MAESGTLLTKPSTAPAQVATSPAQTGSQKLILQAGQFFHDTDGKLSATRLVMILWGLGILVVWIYASISNHLLSDLPSSIVQILGIVSAGKVVQKFGENGPSS